MKVAALVVLCLAVAASAEKKTYEGFKVFTTERLNADQVSLLRKVLKTEHFDFWKEPIVGSKADIMASPDKVHMLTRFLNKSRIQYSVLYEDLQAHIDASKQHFAAPKPKSADDKGPRYSLTWEDYHDYDTLIEFIDELAEMNPDWATSIPIGETHEGRVMKMLRLNKAGPGAKNVLVEAGIHAREWISPAVGTYLFHELVENPENAAYLDRLNFHFIPSANPDGYAYTNEADRMWRKNRYDHVDSQCFGTDLNRNWEFMWGYSGVSDSPCSDVHHGSEPFSELESQNIRDYFHSIEPMPELALCLHSYGELWLYPWGYEYESEIPESEWPENYDELKEMANLAVEALNAVHGERFEAINSAELYPAAGASDDWYKSQGVRFAYTPEMRGPSFVLPPDQIRPSGEEMWAAFKVLLDKLLED